jgi:hypothetical protein
LTDNTSHSSPPVIDTDSSPVPKSSSKAGAIAGGVVAVIVIVAVIAAVTIFLVRRRRRSLPFSPFFANENYGTSRPDILSRNTAVLRPTATSSSALNKEQEIPEYAVVNKPRKKDDANKNDRQNAPADAAANEEDLGLLHTAASGDTNHFNTECAGRFTAENSIESELADYGTTTTHNHTSFANFAEYSGNDTSAAINVNKDDYDHLHDNTSRTMNNDENKDSSLATSDVYAHVQKTQGKQGRAHRQGTRNAAADDDEEEEEEEEEEDEKEKEEEEDIYGKPGSLGPKSYEDEYNALDFNKKAGLDVKDGNYGGGGDGDGGGRRLGGGGYGGSGVYNHLQHDDDDEDGYNTMNRERKVEVIDEEYSHIRH